jgi:hypothetical protein
LPPPEDPREPGVYEDYFALGTGPTELCPIHHQPGASAGALKPAALIK